MIVYHELSSIEADLGVSAKTLYALSNSLSKHYRTVKLPKRDGGERELCVPDEALKHVQRAIAEKLLSLEPISSHATAYRPASGILTNARPHVGKSKILKLDIFHFFDHIRYSAVKEMAFPKERYAENIRVLLTMLCYYQDRLPQGAPSSPAISNIVMYRFDQAIATYCNDRNITYTRYCDDMTFSFGSKDAEIRELISYVKAELKKDVFFLNEKKTRTVTQGDRQSVTGIVVNQKLNISDAYKREIRQDLYFIQKFGVQSHLERTQNPFTPQAYLISLLGKISFVLQVCPKDRHFLEYRNIVSSLLRMTE